MLNRRAAAAFAVAMAAAAPAVAQSLADVARAEEARRATAKKAVKSFSNADLRADEITMPGAVAATAAAQPSAAPGTAAAGNASPNPSANASAPAAAAARAPLGEADWRQRAQSIRNQLIKAQEGANELAAVANDEQRQASERAVSQRRLDRQRKFIAGIEGDWLKLEQDAAAQKVPAEWLGARPTLSTRTPQ